ncbi:MAG: hypothetical protein DME26_11505 [Verrucomicrobia bacterium]|nr:MAG: hypothetical protein DME26_11505 [Verrucomicrobiota bacterium]
MLPAFCDAEWTNAAFGACPPIDEKRRNSAAVQKLRYFQTATFSSVSVLGLLPSLPRSLGSQHEVQVPASDGILRIQL